MTTALTAADRVAWPAWFRLAPELDATTLVIGATAPEGLVATWCPDLASAPPGPYTGVLLADADGIAVARAAELVVPGGWLCVAGSRHRPLGFHVTERHLALPDHRATVATVPVRRSGARLLARSLFLPYASAGPGRRVRRGLMLVLQRILAIVPVRLLAVAAPSQVTILRRQL